MADINNFSFTGRLGSDAKLSKTPNGKPVLELSVANTTGYGDYKKTQWIKVRQWGDHAANIAPIFKKGALVGGSGEAVIEEWTGKDGTYHSNIAVTCMNVQLLVGKKEDTSSQEPVSDNDYSEAVF